MLITAKNRYYAFDICPGFWDFLLTQHEADRVHSIEPVSQELLRGYPDDDLVHWIKQKVSGSFFRSTADSNVVTAFREIMLWVQRHSRYTDAAKADFATKADGWLVAYAMVHPVIIATNEQSNPNSRREIKLGDVCIQFKVRYEDTFDMLRALQAKFRL